MLAEMRRKEMFELLAGMKDVVQRNYAHAKTLLIQNPQLSRTLFLMEIVLGIVEAPDLPDQAKDVRSYEDVEMTGTWYRDDVTCPLVRAIVDGGSAQPNFASLVVNPPPPPMQPLGAFDAVPHQQPMTNYQSIMQAPTMFATSNLSGMNIQPLSPALGVMTGNQQSTATWTASAAGFQGGLAFGTQEHTPMVAQPFAGLIPGMQVLAQQPGGQLVPGMVGSQNHVLLNQPLVGQPQPMVPLGAVQAPTGETEADMAPQQMTASAAPESETLVSSDVLDEQTKSMRSLL